MCISMMPMECYIVDEKFVYDDKGNLIEEYKNHDYENKQGRKKYIYTLEEGSLKRVFDFDKDGKYTYTYDDKGNLIEVVVYFFGGHIFTNYNYDDKGNLIETQIDYKTIFGGAKNIIKYIYDNDGYLIKEYTMIKEKKGGIEGILEEMGELGVGVGLSDAQCNVDTIDYAIYMYNMGKLVKKSRYYYSTSVEESFDEYGKPISLIGEYVYDDKGNIIEENQYGDLLWRIANNGVSEKIYRDMESINYVYDDDGNLKEKNLFYNKSALENTPNQCTYLYTYDEKGDLVKVCVREWNLTRNIMYYEHVYDNNGGKIVRFENRYPRYKYVYDDEKNVVEKYVYEKNVVEKHVYKYDKNRNLIEEKVYDILGFVETPKTITKYEIIYR